MVTVVGHWELSWNAPIKEADLWELPLRDFDIYEWWMWPVSGIRNHEQKVNLHERHSLDEILDELTGTRVYVEPRLHLFPETMDSIWLDDFEHPEDAIYIFGSAHFNPVLGRKGDDLQVSIKTANGDGVLWPHQVLVTVLHDRLVKAWQ